MKIPRSLPETDLARTALLSDDQKRLILRNVRSFKPPLSWKPVRRVAGALFQARASLLDLPKRSLSDIEVALRNYCKKNPDWFTPNFEVAKVLFEFNESRGLKAVERDFPFIPVGYGGRIKFWHDHYSVKDGKLFLSFIDPRLNDGVSALGRLFMFSAMRHNVAVGDFESATLEILRFPRNKFTGKREVEVFSFDESDIVDEATLNSAIDRTYKIWQEVLTERPKDAPPATGTEGSGFL
jgi:hypothetical protein